MPHPLPLKTYYGSRESDPEVHCIMATLVNSEDAVIPSLMILLLLLLLLFFVFV